MFEEVDRLWHEHFNGASKVEALSWPSVELPGNGIEFGLRETGKVGALGEILPDGHLNFPHLWPGQIPPGQTTVVGGLLLGMGSSRKAVGGFFEAIALALEFKHHAAV